MATKYASATGNWSAIQWKDAATGGNNVDKPGAGDTAESNTFAVTVDENTTCDAVQNTAGGGFTLGTNITLTASAYNIGGASQSSIVTMGNGSTLAGTAYGGTLTDRRGAAYSGGTQCWITTATGGSGSNTNGVYNSSTGTVTIATATGGSGGSAHGAYNYSTGTATIATATGGSGSNACGAFNYSTGVITITTATGGSGSNAYGAFNASTGVIKINTIVGGPYGPGSVGAAFSFGAYASTQAAIYFGSLKFGPKGMAPCGGPCQYDPELDTTPTCTLIKADLSEYNLTDPAAGTDQAATTDVRYGTTYASGNLTGSLRVPAAANVELNIPVDATVGSAILTSQNVRDALALALSSGVTPASGSVDANLISIAASIVKMLAAGYNSIAVNESGQLVLSNGAVQTIDANGRTTTE